MMARRNEEDQEDEEGERGAFCTRWFSKFRRTRAASDRSENTTRSNILDKLSSRDERRTPFTRDPGMEILLAFVLAPAWVHRSEFAFKHYGTSLRKTIDHGNDRARLNARLNIE